MGQDDLVAFARGSDGRWHHWGAVPSAPHRRGGASVKSLVAAILIVLTIGACTTGTSTSAPSQTNVGSSSFEPDSSGSFGSSSPGPSTSGPSPSLNLAIPHADPALEARLPDEFEGKPLTKLSVDPISAAAGGESIGGLAKTIGDGSGNYGLAYASNPTDPTFNLIALRIPGAASTALAEGFAALLIQDTRGAEAEQVSLAGRSVTHITAPNTSLGDTWFYVKSDTLFGVQASSQDRAAALLALLP